MILVELSYKHLFWDILEDEIQRKKIRHSFLYVLHTCFCHTNRLIFFTQHCPVLKPQVSPCDSSFLLLWWMKTQIIFTLPEKEKSMKLSRGEESLRVINEIHPPIKGNRIFVPGLLFEQYSSHGSRTTAEF